MKLKLWLAGALTAWALSLPAQDPARFTVPALLEMVTQAHPVARQAALLPAAAAAELQTARGAFDPTLDLHYNRKDLLNYKENWAPATYYESQSYFLKIPGWVGDVKFGFERFEGLNVNPQNFTPPQGLAFVEFSIPLARDLLLDERRAALQQARLVGRLNEAERFKVLNKLLLDALKAYWTWYEAWQAAQIVQEGYRLAAQRQAATRARIISGDLAPIDSVEASMETQKRALDLREADLALQNARLLLSTYLWAPDGEPLELAAFVRPEGQSVVLPAAAVGDSLQADARDGHPEVRKLRVKLAQYDIETRLRRQQLLPTLDLDVKPLFIPPSQNPALRIAPDYGATDYYQRNYKVGLNFYMPIFLRKERGKLAATQVKQLQTAQELQYLRRRVAVDVLTAYNEAAAYNDLRRTQQAYTLQAQQLVTAEQTRFAAGESSLFLVNSRERSLIAAQEKAVQLEVKYLKAVANLYWVSGAPLAVMFGR